MNDENKSETTTPKTTTPMDGGIANTPKAPRTTKQREAIKLAFAQARVDSRLLSPQEVLNTANLTLAGLGIATVYRNIKTLLEAGELRAITLPGEPDRYQLTEATAPTELFIMQNGAVFTKKPAVGSALGVPGFPNPDPFQKMTYYREV